MRQDDLNTNRIKKKNSISFTLYPAYSRVGRGSLVLRHSSPHFEENENLNKYFKLPRGDRIHNRHVPLRYATMASY